MRDNFALATVFVAVSGVEQTTLNTDEGVIEFGFESTIPMCVNGLKCIRIAHRHFTWRDPDKWT